MRTRRVLELLVTAVLVTLGFTADPARCQVTKVGEAFLQLLVPPGFTIFRAEFVAPPGGDPFGLVRIGHPQSGIPVQLEVMDPDEPDPVLRVLPSSAIVSLGSGRAGNIGKAGELILTDNLGVASIDLFGGSGDATQAVTGSGFVKAWVRVEENGDIHSGYRVSSVDKSVTAGIYHVTFGAGSGLDQRPMSATLAAHTTSVLPGSIILTPQDGFHPDAIQIVTYDTAGVPANRSFTLIVY